MNDNPIEITTSKIWFDAAMKFVNTPEGRGYNVGEAIVLLTVHSDPTKTEDDYIEALLLVKARGTTIIVKD